MRDIPLEIVRENSSNDLCFLCGQALCTGDAIIDVFGDNCHAECLHRHVVAAFAEIYELRDDIIEEGDDEQAIIF